jgi:hypothetical protein
MNPAMQRLFSLLIILTMWQAGVGLTFAKEPGAGLKAERIALPAQKQNLPAPANDQIGKRYALVIGNSDYKSVGKLTNPVSDARAMCKTLRALQFEVDCRENLQHRGAFKEAVSDFTRKIQPNDVALFYYAGHGLELDGENYLIPTGADIRSKAYVEDEAVRVNFVFDELGIAKARLSIVILDACRNNPFSRVRSLSGTGLAIPNSIPSGSIIIFPSAPGKPALDGDGKNGVFTTHLLQHLPTTGVTIEEMFKRVINGVRNDSLAVGQEQIPWMNLSFTGEFCFVGCGTRISPTDYANMLKAKEDIEKNTQTLQNELATRETELQQFKARMTVMQQQFESQQKSQNLSQSELSKLGQQRDELIAKTAHLQTQEQELKRVKTELERLQTQQTEFTKRETEMATARERIALLERQIGQQESRNIGESELQTLRRERDDLIKNNAELQKHQKDSEQAKIELAALQTRLIEYDRQRTELDTYKNKLSQLEVDNRKKDESVRQMRAELETRQDALNTMKERMVTLQQQMETQRSGQRIAAADQERLQKERDELARKAQQLEARERDLQEAKLALSRAEKQGNEQQAKQELAALQNRLSQYDRQKGELDGYKQKLAQLEIDNRKKDESVRQMRAELDSRQQALSVLKERMQSLQTQMETQRSSQRIATSDQERLQKERNELALKAQQLEARERELQEAKLALARAEKQGNEQQAKIDLLALQSRLAEYDRQKGELDGYKLQMARLETEQRSMQVELKQERTRRVQTEEKLKDAAVSTVKDAAFVPPAF